MSDRLKRKRQNAGARSLTSYTIRLAVTIFYVILCYVIQYSCTCQPYLAGMSLKNIVWGCPLNVRVKSIVRVAGMAEGTLKYTNP